MYKNLNEHLKDYTGTVHYYNRAFGFVYTDGVKALCSNFETTSWWLVDLIISYQPRLMNLQEDFQQWTVTKGTNDSAVVVCDDGKDKVLIQQEIPYSDISGNCTVWVESNVILIPSEH